jgi:adenylate cyclase
MVTSPRFRPSLNQVFALTLLGLFVLLGLLLYGAQSASRQTIVDGSETLRRAASERISRRVEAYLRDAEKQLEDFETRMRRGVVDVADPEAVEKDLFAALLNATSATGFSFTRASSPGFDADGARRIGEERRWQVMVYRGTVDPESPLVTLYVHKVAGSFVTDERRRSPRGGLFSAPFARAAGAPLDPTLHSTFVSAASRDQAEAGQGRALWSDLSHFEPDRSLPERERRVVVTAQRVVADDRGGFAGVVRFGLRTEAVNRIVAEEGEEASPQRLFLCDEQGRLVARMGSDDALVEQEDTSLRLEPRRLSPEVALALHRPEIGGLSAESPDGAARFRVEGRDFLASFRLLAGSQDWRVGAVVAEDELPGVAELMKRSNGLLLWMILVSLVILAGGLLTLRAVQGGLRQIDAVTASMQDFDFRATSMRSPFRDVALVMDRLEQAKTALRALGKYVPVDLVRLLYGSGQEPALGGRLQDVSMMFTDIKDFTTLAERLSPDDLARLLGRYLEVMTGAIHAEGGTIDKYIGDSIMALWNAPLPTADHPRKACAAALAAAAAGEALSRSPEWGDQPLLVTRFGLHRDQVLVGHFGAPDRLSYTALGDGVNLASRLEGLNKAYGTTILATEAIRAEAESWFDFRLVDLVAVKGKSRGVKVYELLGAKGRIAERLEGARRYEVAFESYLRRDFAAALAILETQEDDGPSLVLARRCREFLVTPPPAEWDGTYVATSK